MVYKKYEIKKIINQIIREIKKRIPVDKIILFGSYAASQQKEYSDIDLAVISDYFENMDEVSRLELLLSILKDMRLPYLIDIDILGFTDRELKNADYFTITGEIATKGKVIFSKF